MITRRSLLRGFGALLAAPAIVRAASLMPVHGRGLTVDESRWVFGRFMNNLQASIWAESISLAPKEPFIGSIGFVTGDFVFTDSAMYAITVVASA